MMNQLNLQNPVFQKLIEEMDKNPFDEKYSLDVKISVPLKFAFREDKTAKLRLFSNYDYFAECQVFTPINLGPRKYLVSFNCLQEYFKNFYSDTSVIIDWKKINARIKNNNNE